MPSFQKFIAYLKNQELLQPHQLEILHQILFRSPRSIDLSLIGFSKQLGLSLVQGNDLLKSLKQFDIVANTPTTCPKCFYTAQAYSLDCSDCGASLCDSIIVQIEGVLSREELKDYRKFQDQRNLAFRFSKNWAKNGFVYYCLLDLVQSEIHQETSSVELSAFYEKFRNLLKREVLNANLHDVLPLGEIGDCLKLAFLTPSVAYLVLEAVGKILSKNEWKNEFPNLNEQLKFPRMNGIIGKLILPQELLKKPEKILILTLNGALDFNDISLTRLFRFDSEAKTRPEIYDEAFLTVWVQKQVMLDLNWENQPSVELEAGKHARFTDEFSFLYYTLDGFHIAPYPGQHQKKTDKL